MVLSLKYLYSFLLKQIVKKKIYLNKFYNNNQLLEYDVNINQIKLILIVTEIYEF